MTPLPEQRCWEQTFRHRLEKGQTCSKPGRVHGRTATRANSARVTSYLQRVLSSSRDILIHNKTIIKELKLSITKRGAASTSTRRLFSHTTSSRSQTLWLHDSLYQPSRHSNMWTTLCARLTMALTVTKQLRMRSHSCRCKERNCGSDYATRHTKEFHERKELAPGRVVQRLAKGPKNQ